MLDIKFIRENSDKVKTSIKNRGLKIKIDDLLSIDKKKREALVELDNLRMQKNQANDEITKMLKEKKDPKKKISQMKSIAEEIDTLEAKTKELDAKIKEQLLQIPNVCHESLPVGSAKENKIVRTWGEAKKFDFQPKDHMVLCEHLDIMDLPRAAKSQDLTS